MHVLNGVRFKLPIPVVVKRQIFDGQVVGVAVPAVGLLVAAKEVIILVYDLELG